MLGTKTELWSLVAVYLSPPIPPKLTSLHNPHFFLSVKLVNTRLLHIPCLTKPSDSCQPQLSTVAAWGTKDALRLAAQTSLVAIGTSGALYWSSSAD